MDQPSKSRHLRMVFPYQQTSCIRIFMADTSFLTIGKVVDKLKELSDLTISKVRYLEDERSPWYVPQVGITTILST